MSLIIILLSNYSFDRQVLIYRSTNKRWINGNEINIKQFTGETLCEKLAIDLWGNDYVQWLKCADFLQTASFLIAFDTEMTMDADILEEICRLAPPEIMRGEFLSDTQQEYDIITFNDDNF